MNTNSIVGLVSAGIAAAAFTSWQKDYFAGLSLYFILMAVIAGLGRYK